MGAHLMARIRTIKPELPQSESMGRVSRDARLLFVLLWTIVDDAGRTRAASRMLASLLFPYDDDAPRLIEGWLSELEREACIVRYQIEGTSYLEVCKWLIHQKIDRPSQSKFPAPPDTSRILANPRESSLQDLDLDLDLDRRTKDQGAEDRRAPPVDNFEPASQNPPAPAPPPTAAGLACKAMRAKGLADVSPGDPRLMELLKQGATVAELEAIAEDAVNKRKGWSWALAALTGRRKDAGELHLPAAGPPWHATRQGIVAKGRELGLGAWDEDAFQNGRGEMFAPYMARVFKAAGHTEKAAA